MSACILLWAIVSAAVQLAFVERQMLESYSFKNQRYLVNLEVVSDENLALSRRQKVLVRLPCKLLLGSSRADKIELN